MILNFIKMNPEYEINVLCWLIKVKEDKAFYEDHNKEIDFFIEILKEDLRILCGQQSKKRGRNFDIGPYIIQILQLFATFYNSS